MINWLKCFVKSSKYDKVSRTTIVETVITSNNKNYLKACGS